MPRTEAVNPSSVTTKPGTPPPSGVAPCVRFGNVPTSRKADNKNCKIAASVTVLARVMGISPLAYVENEGQTRVYASHVPKSRDRCQLPLGYLSHVFGTARGKTDRRAAPLNHRMDTSWQPVAHG